ncbi:MAG: Hsp20/alpha crystallin family protein [Planctomycetaceae bacterium]
MNTTMTSAEDRLFENAGAETTTKTFSPRFDVWEGDDELILYGDLPGVEPESLDVQYENRQLTIHGKVAPCGRGNDCLYSEYSVGDFYRAFVIGEPINAAAISAELSNGVLTLRLPKSEDAKPRRIDIKVS